MCMKDEKYTQNFDLIRSLEGAGNTWECNMTVELRKTRHEGSTELK